MPWRLTTVAAVFWSVLLLVAPAHAALTVFWREQPHHAAGACQRSGAGREAVVELDDEPHRWLLA